MMFIKDIKEMNFIYWNTMVDIGFWSRLIKMKV